MFGNKDGLTPEQLEETLAPLLERLDKLETSVKKQARQMAELEQQFKECQPKDVQGESQLSVDAVSMGGLSDPVELTSPTLSSPDTPPSSAQTLYLPAPTPDGQFLESSAIEQVGKSIYQMRTEDGVNGQFIMLNTPDAIATAMISISQFVKPACRIEGNTHQQPRAIITLEEGMAQNDNGVWKVVRKARVVFE
ncbi:MAG: hypothetical protein I3J02_12225 [Prevotella sp.]|nr:hypothetical protein [Prevotella sp.]